MKQREYKSSIWRSMLFGVTGLLVVGIMVGLLSAYGAARTQESLSTATPQEPTTLATTTAIPTLAATGIPTARATRTRRPVYSPTPPPLSTFDLTKRAEATEMAIHDAAIRTAVALTHAPTETPGVPPDPPSPTPQMGMISGGCGPANSFGVQPYNCWRGLVNGVLTEVLAGGEGSDGDPNQGVVQVRNHTNDGVYQTPDKVGTMRIAAVNGTRITVMSIQAEFPLTAYVFDLITRQWEVATPLPTYTMTPTLQASPSQTPPVTASPSLSPAPTQVPSPSAAPTP